MRIETGIGRVDEARAPGLELRTALVADQIPDRQRIREYSLPDPRTKFPVMIFREWGQKSAANTGLFGSGQSQN